MNATNKKPLDEQLLGMPLPPARAGLAEIYRANQDLADEPWPFVADQHSAGELVAAPLPPEASPPAPRAKKAKAAAQRPGLNLNPRPWRRRNL